MCAFYLGPSRAPAAAAAAAAMARVEVMSEAQEKFLRDLDALPKDSKEFSRSFDLAVYEYLLTEIEENISTGLAKVVAEGMAVAKDSPATLWKLTSLGNEKWDELEPWEKLQILTFWHKDTDTYERAPTQRQRDVKYPVSTRLVVAKEVGVLEAIPVNRITEGLLASQYPFVSNGSAELILRAACENNAVIFDLTQDSEVFEVDMYYPESLGETKVIGEEAKSQLSVTYLRCEEEGSKVYEVKDALSGKTHTLRRVQSEGWEDRSAPSFKLLNTLVAQMEKYEAQQILVHCRAGIGRTGTLLASYRLAQKIARGEIEEAHAISEAVKTVSKIRLARSPTCVQNNQQLEAVIGFAIGKIRERNAARREGMGAAAAARRP